MAATAALSRRKKQATYGKPSRSINTWNSGNMDALDEDELSVVEPAISKSAGVAMSYSIQKRETKPNSPRSKPTKRREIKEDMWDIPPSESSEDEISPARKQPAPIFSRKGKSNKIKETMNLAPWEKAKAEVTGPTRRDNAKPHQEIDMTLDDDDAVDSVVSPWTIGKEKRAKVVSPAQSSPNSSSAAARLQARRLQSGHSVANEIKKPNGSSKRLVTGSHTGLGPRKRVRSNDANSNEINKSDASTPSCDSPGRDIEAESHAAGTSNDLAFEGDTDLMAATVPSPKANPPAITRTRRGKLTAYSSPRKGVSAPARLSEMLPMDIETTDDARSPSMTTSRLSTPHKSGDDIDPSSPQTAFKTNVSIRQSQLLNSLLPEDCAVPSPSALPMQELRLASARRGPGGLAPRMLTKSSSDVGRPRTKLVDRLKASAPSSDEESSDDDSTVASDVDMSDISNREAATSENNQSQVQSQTIATNTRPKLTYAAAQRSWLKEETLEDELMLDMPSESQQRPAAVTRHSFEKSNSASQQLTFDMEDSDDEGAGRLRTIHELRAGGIERRFMDDIGGLLEDAANHKPTARSRRRSALIDIATKLADKTFAARFYRQGFEQQLLVECLAPSDIIADFALCAAIVVLMKGDPPEHAAQSLKDGGALPMLVRMLGSRSDMKAVAKDRRNNMSKGAQADFLRFVGHVSRQQDVWGDLGEISVTSRTIALKALDLMVSRLRRLGDRSEILCNEEVEEVMPPESETDASGDAEVPADLTLSVSVLESLSTTTVSLSWPAEVIERLRSMLSVPVVSSDKAQNLRFLMLRLCLNLTNGNQKNCKVFAKPDTVDALLQSMVDGFEKLFQDQEESQRTISLDLLVLSMGIMINLTEQKSNACKYAGTKNVIPLLAALVEIFLRGQQRTLEAESVEDGVTNVAFGYLAVVLANLCRDREARHTIASKLLGKKLDPLVEAVHEFVLHHQKVDALNFEGEEGTAVWSAFTEKLKGVLSRLSAEAEADEIDRR